jgi:hypothetical protein
VVIPFTSAQSFKATLVGQINDASGASIPGASITLIEEGTGRSFATLTIDDGSFTVPQVAPGRYQLNVEAPGFKKVTQTGLVLETDQTKRVSLTLQIGEVNETVNVTAEAPLLNTDTSSKGEVVTAAQLQDLPLNGRNFTDLALLVPGMYRRPAEDDQGEGLATAGTRTDASNFILDGVVNRSDRNASVGVNTSVDSIREFNVQTSTFSAEYGRTAGAQINVVSKSGTNRFRGTLFEFLRNDIFDANNFFTAPGEHKSLRRNQFGGSIGGPVLRERTFFFGSYEGTRERRSESALNTAPHASWLAGDFRNVRQPGPDGIPGNADDLNRIIDPFTRREFPVPNVIPASMVHAISKKILPFIPSSNVPGSLEDYFASGRDRSERNQVMAKVDHRIGASDNFYARWAREKAAGFDPFPSARNFYPGFGRDQKRRLDSLVASDTHTFRPNLILEGRVGLYDQRNQNLGENRNTDYISQFGIPGLSPSADMQGFPAIRIDGYSEFGDRPNDPFIYDLSNLQFFGMVNWVAGNQNLKMGADVIRSSYNERDVRNVRGDFRFRGRNTNPAGSASSGFRSFADFLLGLPDATQRQIGAEPADLTGYQYAIFLQNDWRVHPRLTLNLGLRYELQTPLSEATGRLANFIPERGGAIGKSRLSTIPGRSGQEQFWPSRRLRAATVCRRPDRDSRRRRDLFQYGNIQPDSPAVGRHLSLRSEGTVLPVVQQSRIADAEQPLSGRKRGCSGFEHSVRTAGPVQNARVLSVQSDHGARAGTGSCARSRLRRFAGSFPGHSLQSESASSHRAGCQRGCQNGASLPSIWRYSISGTDRQFKLQRSSGVAAAPIQGRPDAACFLHLLARHRHGIIHQQLDDRNAEVSSGHEEFQSGARAFRFSSRASVCRELQL